MTRHENPVPTVDVIIEMPLPADADRRGGAGGGGSGGGGATGGATGIAPGIVLGIVLIERRNEPRGWALPGGFVDRGESLADAARREAMEETRLEVELVEQFFSYSRPDRDARMHTISTVFLGRATGRPVGADDAARAQVFALDALPSPLVFDHAQIVADYATYRATGARPPPDR